MAQVRHPTLLLPRSTRTTELSREFLKKELSRPHPHPCVDLLSPTISSPPPPPTPASSSPATLLRRALQLRRAIPSPASSRAILSAASSRLLSVTASTEQNTADTAIDLSNEESRRRLVNSMMYRSKQRGFLELGTWVEQDVRSMDEANIRSLLQILDLKRLLKGTLKNMGLLQNKKHVQVWCRQTRHLDEKKKKCKAGKVETHLEFPGREKVKFGEVVEAPPKLSFPKR
ncbi:uncharacterized protein LOC119357885 [Triticum dicoccoides]|uniref:uncharacterized protein LOC119357885 n=1 Tax=Triticum dicoccoides TaxID=85692 RepID=UPI00188E3FFC|nr:uncharacterized protein LOC119357885 [Triticum dicoccoides]